MAKKKDVPEITSRRPREEYLQDREVNIKAENEQSSSFDKYVLTLASGTFGITLTFIKNIIGTEKVIPEGSKWILYLGWGLLVLSICCTLFSFRTSVAGYRWYIRKLDKEQADPSCETEKKNSWSAVTSVLNTSSIISFIFGSVAIFLFVVQNL